MTTYSPLNTSFPFPTDVDGYAHPSRDIENYGATTITTGVYMSVPNCGPAAVHNLAVPVAPAMATYAGAAPAMPAAQPQPTDPTLI